MNNSAKKYLYYYNYFNNILGRVGASRSFPIELRRYAKHVEGV